MSFIVVAWGLCANLVNTIPHNNKKKEEKFKMTVKHTHYNNYILTPPPFPLTQQVSGSTKKVRPQKGGGTSRAGHKRPPHWRGGGRAHGPKGVIQDYGKMKLNKKVRSLGVLVALSERIREGGVVIVKSFDLEGHTGSELIKTSTVSKATNRLLGLNAGKKRALFLCGGGIAFDDVEEGEENDGVSPAFVLACRNLDNVHCMSAKRGINVYDLMRNEKVVIDLKGVRDLVDKFGER